jgi:hypothetical protein
MIKIIEGFDNELVQIAVNEFEQKHKVFATQHSVMLFQDQIKYVFVIYYKE